jgi:hypothetical protein
LALPAGARVGNLGHGENAAEDQNRGEYGYHASVPQAGTGALSSFS